MLTLTLCTAALFLLALIGLVLVAVGLPVGAVMLLLGLLRTPRQAERILPGLVVFLLGLALLYH